MHTKNSEMKKDPNEISEEKQIKNAIIDLSHNNKDLTDKAISKATGIGIFRL